MSEAEDFTYLCRNKEPFHDLTAVEPICHNLAVVAEEATVPAYPLKLASFCISLHIHSFNGDATSKSGQRES